MMKTINILAQKRHQLSEKKVHARVKAASVRLYDERQVQKYFYLYIYLKTIHPPWSASILNLCVNANECSHTKLKKEIN